MYTVYKLYISVSYSSHFFRCAGYYNDYPQPEGSHGQMQHAQHVPTSVGAATGVYTTSQWLVISGRIRCNSDKPSGIT